MGQNTCDGAAPVSEKDAATSFVARFWLEQQSHGPSKWRGHIKHVQSGKEEYFDGLTSMQTFLDEVTGVSLPDGQGE